MKTYKFKLYQARKNKYLHSCINASGSIYNHCIALHKRYYRMFGKHLNMYRLMKHIAKLRKRIKYWQQVGSQAVQDICQRIEKAYQLFFKNNKKGTRPPNFKKTRKYKSFTLKQAGYKLLGGNRIKIGKKTYKLVLCREIKGKIKTLTVKRNPLGELFILVVTDFVEETFGVVTGKIAGFDFGLKTFLTVSDGTSIESPLFFNQFRTLLKSANKNLSSKKRCDPASAKDANASSFKSGNPPNGLAWERAPRQKCSNNWYKARASLARVHELISNKRKDWFWKLAHQLTNEYDVLIFEDLNLKAMKRLWGRKISDLSFASFLEILLCVANNKGKTVHFVDRFYPSSKTCSCCGYINKELSLKERQWDCPSCNTKGILRDLNAAVNLQREGASSLGLDTVRLSSIASVA
ncbi:MAG: RNA-guided endonuclease TnpB family protein [Xenococcaceae cyanobacterium MO_207.B15]|nr:RNA-guided endonuclease TnpB family protein [Xenococcaceae cyanobacterium MO_207.B15]